MQTSSIPYLQTVFSERAPYWEDRRLGETLVVFEPVFLRNLREALTSGCMIKMSEDGFNLTNDYVNYVDGLTDETPVLKALDTALVDIVNCTYENHVGDCTLSSVYEFNECGA